MHTILILSTPRLLGAALSDHPSLRESIPYQLNGLAVVFIALGLIWLSLEVLCYYFKRTAIAPAPEIPVVVAAPVAAPVPDNTLSPELIAVIAATVRVSLEGPYRIQAIVPVPAGQDWAHEGRRQIFASHQVR